MNNYEILFLQSLLRTILIETSVLFSLVKVFLKLKKIPTDKIIFAGIFCSFATLPYLRFIGPAFIPEYILLSAIGEILVFLLEAVMLKYILELPRKEAVLLSFLVNTISYGVGLLIM